MYTIKTQLTVDGKPYMAGIGVGENVGVITSQILLAAQRVAVLNEANGSTSVPFVIQDGVYLHQLGLHQGGFHWQRQVCGRHGAAVNGQPVYSINWRTGVQQSVSLNGGIKSEQGTGYWHVTDTSTGVVVLEIDARG